MELIFIVAAVLLASHCSDSMEIDRDRTEPAKDVRAETKSADAQKNEGAPETSATHSNDKNKSTKKPTPSKSDDPVVNTPDRPEQNQCEQNNDDATCNEKDPVVEYREFVNPNYCYRIEQWQTSDYQSASGGRSANRYPSFAVGNFYYVNTQGDKVVVLSTQEDGTPKSWQDTGFRHGGIHGFTAVSTGTEAFMFRNGHIGKYAFNPTTGLGTVNDKNENEYTFYENNPEQVFDGFKWVWDSAVSAKFANGNHFIFHLGGWGHTVSSSGRYRHYGDIFAALLPFTPHATKFSFTGVINPEGRPGSAAFYLSPAGREGFIYLSGQNNENLHRSTVNDDGTLVGDWEEVTPPDLSGNANNRGDLFVLGRTLGWIRGSKVNLYELSTSGDITVKIEAPDLPEQQLLVNDWGGETNGASWGIIKDKLYVTASRYVYWSQLIRTSCAD